ncbi:MAG: hypothetical protein QXS27_01285, partial [Candidatus Jordarchaeaceae archaeon]
LVQAAQQGLLQQLQPQLQSGAEEGRPCTVVEESPAAGEPLRRNIHAILQPTKITLIWTGLLKTS